MPENLNPLDLEEIAFQYESGIVLHKVSLSIASGDYVLLLGANGSGKSTLIRVALGLLEPTSGKATLFGRPVNDPRSRGRVGYVPQRAAISARVPATCLEVVVSGRAANRIWGGYSRADRDAARHALERVGMESFAQRRIGELSGGQQQRILIARALANDPELLVMDEPTAGVDRDSQLQFAANLRNLNDAGLTIIIAAHDLGALGRDITRVVALHHGHIDEISPAQARDQVGLFLEDHPH